MKIKTMGFPTIRNFPGDIREYTPGLFAYLDKFSNIQIVLEDGYGERLGYCADDYLHACQRIKFSSMNEVYQQDMIVILKNPDLANLELLRDGAILFTMIHYDTRPSCVELIERKNLKSFSMDALVDDYGIRTFVDYLGTAYSGCVCAFQILKQTRKDFDSRKRKPFVVTILGAGGVAQGCIKSFELISDAELFANHLPGMITQVITRSITSDAEALKEVFAGTDIIVDATKRSNYSKAIISNHALGNLPDNAIILDLAADRYDTTVHPPLVRALEGTVKGTPNKKVIFPDDPLYNDIPSFIDATNRRVTVSCDAWPSARPKESIAFYEVIMKNYLNILLVKDIDNLDPNSDNTFERSLYRSTISYYENKKDKTKKQ